MNRISLYDALDGARLVKVDNEQQVIVVWSGNDCVNAYVLHDRNLIQCGHWNVLGEGPEGKPSIEEVSRSMKKHIEDHYYPH
jgi:hypothetical protein